MFTGIVESTGRVSGLQQEGDNLHIAVQAEFLPELKIDQSISHNGACLTVVALEKDSYSVTAVGETLRKTNLGRLKVGDTVNLERCMKLGDRLDGHIVQGHVDTTGVCTAVEDQRGSWKFSFRFDPACGHVLIPKGSICVNGVSLTVVDLPAADSFSVVIIPYTMEHTNFKQLRPGDSVNLEFDMIGKYVSALVKR
ncbi:MAG: riboflavin synthase [Bacteroidetes bacterium]|nr:MAG: riboflavin synthase [Bacteroidota bacterium]